MKSHPLPPAGGPPPDRKQADKSQKRHNGQFVNGSDLSPAKGPYQYE